MVGLNLLILLVQAATAIPVAFRASSASSTDYSAYLAAHRDYNSPVEAHMNMRPTEDNRSHLLTQFADAQEAFLNQDLETARQKFMAIVNERTSDDWNSSERQLLLQSALRLAQLASTEKDRQDWLYVALSIDPGLETEENLFPPPLIQAWRSLKKRTPTWTADGKKTSDDWDRILINGVPCNKAGCTNFFVTDLDVRITWLSNRWESVTKVMRINGLEHTKPTHRPWVMGKCQVPIFSAEANVFKDKIAFFDEPCLKTARTPTNLNLQPTTSNPTSNPRTFGVFNEDKPSRPFYKSPWLWVGVGAAIAIIVATSQKQNERTEPVTTYGY